MCGTINVTYCDVCTDNSTHGEMEFNEGEEDVFMFATRYIDLKSDILEMLQKEQCICQL